MLDFDYTNTWRSNSDKIDFVRLKLMGDRKRDVCEKDPTTFA